MCQNYAAFYHHRPSALLLDCAAGVFIVREVFVLCVARWQWLWWAVQWLQICPAPSYKCINALLKKIAHSFAKAICAGLISNYCHTIQINLNSSKKPFHYSRWSKVKHRTTVFNVQVAFTLWIWKFVMFLAEDNLIWERDVLESAECRQNHG